MKTCPQCNTDKPEASFGKRVASPVSTKKYSQSWCSECRKESVYKGRGKIPLPVVDWSRRQLPPRQFEVSLPIDVPIDMSPGEIDIRASLLADADAHKRAILEVKIPTDRNELKALYHRLTNDRQSRSANWMAERLLSRWKRGERW